MPDYIDPNWEYREENPEVLEVLTASPGVWEDGFEIRRNPTSILSRLSPEKVKHQPTNRIFPKSCKICNRLFKPDRVSQSICHLCPQPATRWNGVTPGKPCLRCGKVTGHRKRKMCTVCHRLWRIENARQLASARNTRVVIKCAQCGKDFEASKSHKKFCSRDCYHNWKVGRRVTLFPRRCSFCNVEFQPSRQHVIYCSPKCSVTRRWRDERLKKHMEQKSMTLEVAIEALQSGMKFGDVLPFLSNPERDEDTLRHYFVHGCLPQDSSFELPPVVNGSVGKMNGTNSYHHSPPEVKVATGDICSGCGGLMVRTGTCLTCQGCGASSGGCG